MLEVLEPGLLTTIQDVGRPEWTHLGVPTSGGCDPLGLAIANLLSDADPGAPALEMTLIGPTLAVHQTGVISLAGAELDGRVRETGRRLVPGRSHRVEAGTTLEFPGVVDSGAGARAYLGLPGGIDVPLVLGSASTCLVAGFGGLGGRPLQVGDRLRPRRTSPAQGDTLAGRIWPSAADSVTSPPAEAPIRLLDGPHLDLLGDPLLDALVASDWTVATGSNRVGLRLDGPAIGPADGSSPRELLSHGVVWGAIQIPPDGMPIVLLADHHTTGGYPVAAVVIAADRPRLGQLRPGSTVRFERTDLAAAREALRRQRLDLASGAAVLRESRIWDELAHWTGG